MFKFSLIVVLALTVYVAADPLHQRLLNRRVFARQEALPTPKPTGYAPAGVTPEIPFELPTETEKPAADAQQPDEVYGPPESETSQPDEIYGPPEAETQKPDEVYGPPETDDLADNAIAEEVEEEPSDLETVEKEVSVDENGEIVSARLVFQRRQPLKAAPARLTKAKLVKPAGFVYTTRYERFPKNK